MLKNNSEEIVERCYLNFLHRKPDEAGLKHFTRLLERNQIDEDKLIYEMDYKKNENNSV